MRHLTLANLIAVIRLLPNEFESHDVIQALMKASRHAFVRELHASLNTPDPFKYAHAKIGMAIHDVPGVVPVQRVRSPNVRGPSTINQKWRKVVRPATTPATNAVA